MRTSGVETARVQEIVALAIRDAASGEDPLGESADLQSVEKYLLRRKLHENEVKRISTALRTFQINGGRGATWQELETRLREVEKKSMVVGASANVEMNSDACPAFVPGEISSETETVEHRNKVEATEVSPKEGYVVSISGKKKLRRLHFRGSCHRIPGIDYLDFEDFGRHLPAESQYDDYCRQCWRGRGPVQVDEESVHTESESSSSESNA